MLRALFDLFQITESQLSRAALLRLRLASIVGLFAVPLGVIKLRHSGQWNLLQFDGWYDYAFVLTIIGFIFVAGTRAVNRLFIPDAYLDEGEITRKRQVNSTVFNVFMSLITIVLIIFVLLLLSGYRELNVGFGTTQGILIFLMAVFMPLFCLQGFLVSLIAKPLDFDGESLSFQKQDYKYLFLLIGFVGGCIFLATQFRV